MNKAELQSALTEKYGAFISYIDSLSENDFEFAAQGKWSAGQQLDHLVRSTSPLADALTLPKFIIGMLFGKANRESKSYDDLVAKYHAKLDGGGKASGRFIPKPLLITERGKRSGRLFSIVKKLNRGIDSYSEKQLDEYILPHPLLGKVTIREMIYFTIYHAEHHQRLIKTYLTQRSSGVESLSG